MRKWYCTCPPCCRAFRQRKHCRFSSVKTPCSRRFREMDRAVALPGVVNSWTMPIRGRTDMLTTGARTTVAVKVKGSDLKTAQEIGQQVEATLKTVPGTRSAFAERAGEGFFVDIQIDRDRLANRGLQVAEVQEVIAGAIGGAVATVTALSEHEVLDKDGNCRAGSAVLVGRRYLAALL